MKSFLVNGAVVAMLFTAPATIAFAQDFSTGQAARLVIGQSTFTQSDEGAQNNLIGSAAGLAIANGMLFVVDANHFTAEPSNNRVLIFPTTNFPGPTAELANNPQYVSSANNCWVCVGTATNVLGQPDFNNNAVNLSQSGFRNPVGAASDGIRLAIADTDNNRVLIWNSIPTQINQPADVVVGQPDFSHNNTYNPPKATSMRGPEGVWFSNGKMFVADTQDNRVLIYNSIPRTNGATPDVVVGQPNLTTTVPLLAGAVIPTQSNMYSPVSVSSDGVRLYVTDIGSNRVLIWNSIPTSNGAPADVVLGQADFTSGFENNSAVLCPTSGTDANGVVLYPALCNKTLSFPRFALSNGTELFIADGGNDRVLIYSTIPTTNGASADKILGQVNDQTDNGTDGASHMYTPTSLAWSNGDLYVADAFNRRVLVYSKGMNLLPLSAVRNAASLEVFAAGTVTIGGSITAKDTVAIILSLLDVNGITVNTKTYTYTVQANDSLTDIVNGLVSLINVSPGDPNATATAQVGSNAILLEAKRGGNPGLLVNYSTAISTNATETATAAGTTLSINLADATQIAPGSLVTIFGTGLTDQQGVTITGQPDSGGYYPSTLGGIEVFVDGIRTPLVSVSDTQINAQMPYPVFDRTSSSVYIRTTHRDGTVTVTTPEGVSIVGANPGIFADTGVDPRPGFVYHAYANATGVISVDGLITAGNVGSISVGADTHATGNITIAGTATPGDSVSVTVALVDGNSATLNTATYTYGVQPNDTIGSIVTGLVTLINASDPNVSAQGNPDNGVIQLSALTFGTNGTLVNFSAAVSGSGETATAGGTALTITSKTYTYTVSATDTLQDIANNFVSQINADPNSTVTAQPSNVYTRILLIAKQKGAAGEAIPIAVSVTTGTDLILTALSSQTCCSSTAGGLVTDDSPAQPGEVVYVYATGLGLTTNGIPTGQIAGPDNTDQPTTPVDSILAGGTTANILFTNYAQGKIGTFQVVFQLSSSLTTNVQTQLTIAQVYFVSNVVTFNVTVGSTASAVTAAAPAVKRTPLKAIPKKQAKLPKRLQRVF